MVTKSPENNTTAETENNIIKPIISTVGTPISESPEGKKITTNTQKNTSEVKKEIKTQFDIISENTEYNEILQDLIDGTAFYIDSQLGKDFSKIEKDNIKLVLLSYLTEKVNNIDLSIINGIKNGIEKKLKGILELFKNEKDNDVKKENFNSLFETLGINGLQKDLDDKIVQIKDDRENKKFREIGEAFDSIEGVNKPEGEIFDNIQAELKKASQKFDKFSDIGKKVKGTADKLGMGNILQDVILWLQKEFPFLGSILAMFLGGIESNGGDKKEKSTANLTKFIKNKKKSPLDKIEENKYLKIKGEDLKDFYTYLDSKNINYSDKNFWTNFLNGKNDNGDDIPNKVTKLKDLLDSSFKDGDSMQNISLEDFVKKLNNLGKIETKNKIQKIDKQIKKLEKQLTQTNVQQDKQPTENDIELEKKIYDLKFRKSLLTVGDTNKIYFKFKGKELKEMSIDISGKSLELDGEKYNIELLATEHNNMQILKNINFSGNNVVLEYTSGFLSTEKKVLSPEKFGEILKTFGENGGSYSQKIPGKPATLKIQKA